MADRSRTTLVALPLVLALLAAAPSHAGTWRVGRNQNDCTPPCHWYDGHPQVPHAGFAIQTAMLRLEVLPGDTVMVWQGEYPARVAMKSGVVLISKNGPAVTSFRGNASGEPALFFVGTDPVTAVRGFTFTWDALFNALGGGVAAYIASGTIRDCVFRSNHAGTGSAIYMQSCDLVVENNLFVTNNCAAGGGTIAVSGGAPTIRRNTFSANAAPFGFEGATLYATGTGVIFDRNIVHGSVGAPAVFCGGGNQPTISCNVFWNNALGAFAGQCVDSVGTSGNVAADPLFCNPGAGNYGVCADSPALVGPCGVIGYTSPGGNCGPCQPTSVAAMLEAVGWGRLKSFYR